MLTQSEQNNHVTADKGEIENKLYTNVTKGGNEKQVNQINQAMNNNGN